jgi:putative transposase
MRKANRKERRIKGREDRELVEFFVRNGQFLLPMMDQIELSGNAVDELIDVVGRSAIEAVLELSAAGITGAKSQGRRVERENDIRWHGQQWGSVHLSDRKMRVERPRLRTAGPKGKEVAIPAYEALQDNERMGASMLKALLSGVSTRNYQHLIREMAETVGVSKSSVSREFVEQSARQLEELNKRKIEKEILVVYLDGMVYGEHHVLGAVGIDREGFKQVLGVRLGSSENAVVAKDLLVELVNRGLRPGAMRLFVIDGAKALRKAIREVFGEYAVIQRCRAHKLRNVLAYLPEHLRDQTSAVIRAAYRLPYKEGMARLKTQAAWLEKDYPEAASSILEGLEETFTVNRLGLTAPLLKSLTTTNIVENPNGTVRRQTRRVGRWRNAKMVLRWAASAFLSAENRFNRVGGYRDLWILENALFGISPPVSQTDTDRISIDLEYQRKAA